MIYNVKHIVQMRSMKRNKDTCEMMVEVIWEGGSVSMQPISDFYNLGTNSRYYNEHMDIIVTSHKNKAMKYPYHKRNCIVCNERVYDGMLFCGSSVLCMSIKERYE